MSGATIPLSISILLTGFLLFRDLAATPDRVVPGEGEEVRDSAELIDQEDLAYLFSSFDITRGRYTVHPGKDRFALDFVVEGYEQGELVEEVSASRLILEMLQIHDPEKGGMYLRRIHENMAVDSIPREVRLYVHQGRPGELTMNIVLDGSKFSVPASVDTTLYGPGGAHSFEFDRLEKGERRPLMAVYYVARGEGFVPCPSSAPVETIVRNYPLVYIVYGVGVPLD